MKKISFYAAIFACLPLFGQQCDSPHEKIIDTIIKISMLNNDNSTWNYTGISFPEYPNTTSIDLKKIQNVKDLITQNSTLQLNDSIVGELPSVDIVDGNLSFRIEGNYQLKRGRQGNLMLTNDTLTTVNQYIYTENYFLLHENDSMGIDTVAYYSNTYYSFLNLSTTETVFEVFNKKRWLKGQTNWEFDGISICSSCLNNLTPPAIYLNLSPNPTSEFTIISFTLTSPLEISISMSNLTNTVNEILYTGLATEGLNEFQLTTQNYSAGNYTLTVSTPFGQYSTSLIIL
jgi:hypothetical protein